VINAPNPVDALSSYLSERAPDEWHVTLKFAQLRDIVGANTFPVASFPSDESFRLISQAAARAGFGISVVGAESETRAGDVVFSRGLHRWPALIVDSSSLADQPPAQRLRSLSEGYLWSARTLCIALAEARDVLVWSRASVVRFSYLHAVELFLKACILQVGGNIADLGHEISKLQRRYTELLPGTEYRLETPHDLSLSDIEQATGVRVAVEPVERHADQLFRYFGDRRGRAPRGRYFFAPGSTLALIERLEADTTRIWNAIQSDRGA